MKVKKVFGTEIVHVDQYSLIAHVNEVPQEKVQEEKQTLKEQWEKKNFIDPRLYKGYNVKRGLSDPSELQKLEMLMKKADVSAIKSCVKLLKEGKSICMFPEGTRSKTEDMLPFKKGSFRIAEKANAKVVPVGILNTDEVFEKHLPRITSGTIYISYGKPIDLPNMSKEERNQIHSVAQSAVQEILDKLKADI